MSRAKEPKAAGTLAKRVARAGKKRIVAGFVWVERDVLFVESGGTQQRSCSQTAR